MKLTSEIYLQDTHKLLRIRECNGNMRVMMKNLNLTDQQVAKFKIDSKKMHLLLGHFYSQLSEGELAINRYQTTKKQGLKRHNERNLKTVHDEIESSLKFVSEAKNDAYKAA